MAGFGTRNQFCEDDSSDSESTASSSSYGGDLSSTVHVGKHLPPYVMEKQLNEHFNGHGFSDCISRITLVRDHATGNSKGFAFIVFKSPQFAEDAISIVNGTKVMGKYAISVSLYKPKDSKKNHRDRGRRRRHDSGKEKSATQPSSAALGESCQVFVGSNLPPHINAKHLRDHFNEFAPYITNTFIKRDPDTKASKGYGFVTFSSTEQAHSAIAKLHKSFLHGKHRLNVQVDKHRSHGSTSVQSQPLLQSPVQSTAQGPAFRQAQSPTRSQPPSHQLQHQKQSPQRQQQQQRQRPIPPPAPGHPIPAPAPGHYIPAPVPVAQRHPIQHQVPIVQRHPIRDPVPIIQQHPIQHPFQHQVPIVQRNPIRHQNPIVHHPIRPQVPIVQRNPIPQQHPVVQPAPRQFPFVPQQCPPPLLQQATPVVPPPKQPPKQLPELTGSTTVICENLSPVVTESEFTAFLVSQGYKYKSCKLESVKSGKSNKAVVQFLNSSDADLAIKKLHKQNMLGRTIYVKHQVQAQSPEVAADKAKESEIVMELSPDQWNQLMHAESHGATLFQELVAPYAHNPSVKIQALLEKRAVVFTGVQDAIVSASQYFKGKLNKKIHVESPVMEALVAIFPFLADEISHKFNVKVSGYSKESNFIQFEGPQDSVSLARNSFDEVIQKSVQKVIPWGISNKLLYSAKEKLSSEGIQVHIDYAQDQPRIQLFAFSSEMLERASAILSKKPFENFVKIDSADVRMKVMESFQSLEEEYCVSLVSQNDRIVAYSFVKQSVQAVRKQIESTVKDVTQKKEPLNCSPEQIAYLSLLIREPTSESQMLFSSLPARITYEAGSGSLVLLGSPESIQKAQSEILDSQLLNGLLHRSYDFSANFRFLSQIQQYVLKPKQKEIAFQYTTSQQQRSGKEEPGHFTIVVFSKSSEDLRNICYELEVLEPKSRRQYIHHNALSYVRQETPGMEKKWRVRIVIQEKGFVVIYGLTPEDIDGCWDDLYEKISSSVIVVQHVSVTPNQLKYLRIKHLVNLSTESVELYMPRGFMQEKEAGSPSIRIKGTMAQVDKVKEQIEKLIGSYIEENLEVRCPSYLKRMWTKRWQQIKTRNESSYDLILDYAPATRQTRKGSSSDNLVDEQAVTAFNFAICGSDAESIKELKDTILNKENGQMFEKKDLTLSEKCCITLLKGLKAREIEIQSLTVELRIKKEAGIVTIITPSEVSEDLQAAEEEILRYVDARTYKTALITSSEPVVGLILASQPFRSNVYLNQAQKAAEPHKVNVRLLTRKPRIGFQLSGMPDSIEAVKPAIESILARIKSEVHEMKFRVPHISASAFALPEFSRFTSKLADDLCVICSYPREGKQNKLLKHVLVQPSSTAHCVVLEIATGSLVSEQVDAIVNTAGSDLRHTGGLSKSILQAGGPAIQSDCDTYFQDHGSLIVSEVVCFDSRDLLCKKLIHAVGPKWNEDSVTGTEAKLYLTVFNALKLAEKEEVGSISLPAISTGGFGVPDNICAQASLKAVRDFCQATSESTIHTVRFVLFEKSTAEAFLQSLSSETMKDAIKEEEQVTSDDLSAMDWFWQNDTDVFVPYSPGASSQLSSYYSDNPLLGSFQLSIGKHQYQISFSTMQQVNVATKKSRKIKFMGKKSTPKPSDPKKTPAAVQWYYMNDSNVYAPYSSADSSKIEECYRASGPCVLTINANLYSVDFTTMKQENLTTKYCRSIKREPSTSESNEAEASIVVKEDVTISLKGPKRNLDKARERFEGKMKSLFSTRPISLPPIMTAAFTKKLRAIAQQHDVTYTLEGVESELEKKSLVLEGLTQEVDKTHRLIQEEIIKFQQSADSGVIQYPPEWQRQTANTEVFPLATSSLEWQQVAQKFQATLSGCAILKINRIQNKWLWEEFVQHKKRLHKKNNGAVNEKDLFHGTRGNPPEQIYKGEEGFDMRYSNKGMWGQANYFAANANYSDGYAYISPLSGHKEMFLVKVLTGESYDCPSDSSLKMPPAKPVAGASQLQFSVNRYDTVTGVTHGSRVYMTYDNKKAYPAYLIQYM